MVIHDEEENNKNNINITALMRPMHNMMVGLKHANRYRTALNDIYVSKLKGVNGTPNPSPREIVRIVYMCLNICL